MEKIIKLSKKVVLDKFPDIYAALVTGSFIKGTFNNKSDIDIILISNSISSTYNQKIRNYCNSGYDFDITVLPKHRVISLIIRDVVTLKGALIDMLSYGKIIRDNNDFLLDIINYTKLIRRNYYPSLDLDEIDTSLIMISNALEDLYTPKTTNEEFFIITFIIDKITNLNIRRAKGFFGNGKNKSLNLKKYCPVFYNDLEKAVINYKKHNNESIVKLIKNNLKTFGNIRTDYFFRNPDIFIDNYYDDLIIKIPKKIIEIEIFSGLRKSKELLEKKHSIYFFYFTKKHLIIILKKTRKDKAFNIFFWIFSSFQINFLLKDKIVIQRYYPESIIHGKKNQILINNYLSTTSNLILNLQLKTSFIDYVNLCLDLYKFHIKKFGLDNYIKEITEYLYELWLPDSYDYDFRYNPEQLKKRKNQKVLEFHFFVQKNKKILTNTTNKRLVIKNYFLSAFDKNDFLIHSSHETDLNLIYFSLKDLNVNKKDVSKISIFIYLIGHLFSQFNLINSNNKAIIPYILKHNNVESK